MKVEELLISLSQTELSNLAIGNDGDGRICDKDVDKLLIYLTDGLTKLFSKFVLRTVTTPLAIVPNVVHYSPNFPYTFKILKVYSEVLKVFLPINNESSSLGVSIDAGMQITLATTPTEADVYTCTRHLNHEKVTKDNLDMVLDVPDVLMDALRAYMAFKVYHNMNTQEAAAIAKVHLGNYTSILTDVRAEDLVMDSIIGSNQKFDNNGGV